MTNADVRTKEGGMAERVEASGRLGAEVRQSLSLIGMTALTLAASIAFGLFVGHLG
jgi:hypothetical protein